GARHTRLIWRHSTMLVCVMAPCLAPDRFFVVCNAGPRSSVVEWLKVHAARDVALADRTTELLCLAVQGPRAPELLQRFTSVDLRHVKPIHGVEVDFNDSALGGAHPGDDAQ